jgi:hypothetical protein
VDTGSPETSTHVWSIQSTQYNSLREELEVMQEMVHNLRWLHIGAFGYLYRKLKHLQFRSCGSDIEALMDLGAMMED